MDGFKLNIDLVQAQTGLKELVASIDRLNGAIDRMGQKVTTHMTAAATGSRKVKSALSEQAQEYKRLGAEIVKLQNKRSSLDNKQKQRLSDMIQQQKRLGIEMAKTGTTGAAAAGKVTAAQSAMNKQVSLGRQLFLRLKSVMLTVFGAYAIIQGVRNTINTIKEFELGMARLQAITGATKQSIDLLSASAKNLAANGIFNATEIAEVQVQLAKFGFTLDEISNSTEGIIKLATATGEDLNSSAILVSSSLRALGLDASETGRLVDVLGKSFTSSALDINKFRESAKYVLPLARQMGWTIEEVAATLGKLADSGISGSLAGTGLRQTFIQLWDASSDLSKVLGSGIKTFDEFYDAIERTKKEGVAFDTLLDAIPTRAKTMFTVLYNGVGTIRDLKGELNNANGAISDMANIQLDTLAYQMERFDSAWDSFVLSIGDNGGWITDMFRGFSRYLQDAANAIDPLGASMRRAQQAVIDFKNELKGTGRENNLDAIREQIVMVSSDLEIAKHNLSLVKDQFAADLVSESKLKDATALVKGLETEVSLLNDELFNANVRRSVGTNIDEILKSTAKLSSTGVSELEAFSKSYNETISTLEDIRGAFPIDSEQRKTYDAIIDGVRKYYDEYKAVIVSSENALALEREKRLDEWIREQQMLLDIEQQNMTLRAKRIVDEQAQGEQLLGIQKYFTIKKLELQIQSGELTVSQARAIREQIIEIEKSFQLELLDLRKDYNDEDLAESRANADEQIKIQEELFAIRIQEMKNAGVSEQEVQRETLKFQIQVLKTQILIAKAFGATAEEIAGYAREIDLIGAQINGVIDEDDVEEVEDKTKKVSSAYKKMASEIIDALSTIFDAQVESTQNTVNDLNTRIAEVQRDLEIETDLYRDGYANNVSAKKKEYDELKAARDQALADRDAALRRQQTMEAIAQAVDLASAVANTINIYSDIPWVGPLIAAGVVAGFIALFKTSQAKIKNSTQYGGGGEIMGASHSRGGVDINAEGGEFVVKKSAYAKHAELVQAINDDNLPTLNADILSNTTIDKSGNVVINNEIWNKMYDLWDKNLNGDKVEVIGGKKIITRGSKRRIVNV